MTLKLLRKKVKNLEWHHAYYLLAIIDIFTILAALSLTQALMSTYESSVDSNRKMSTSVSEFIKLGYIAQSVNEPGNRVFETKDVESELLSLNQNLVWFNTALNRARENLANGFSLSQLDRLDTSLVALSKSMDDMVNETHLIFSAIRQSDLQLAGRHMSMMDSYYYKVTQAIGDMTQYISDIQLRHLEQQVLEANRIKKFEIIISIVVLIIITSVTVYGHKLGQKLKRNASHIKRALVEAQQSKKAKETFLANMSHEIRTPMNGILGLLKLIDTQALSSESKNYLKLASASADSLLLIINDILDLSKIEHSQLQIENQVFNVKELVEQQLEIYQHTSKDNSAVSLSLDITQLQHIFLKTDKYRLLQVFNNLLNNALKFTESGKVEVSVKTQVITDGVLLTIDVSDTGIGIAEEQQSMIFDQFTQADATTTRKFGGTGLGLAISKKLCQLMGGDLTLRSELNKGSCFTLTVLAESADSEPSTLPQDSCEDSVPLNLHVLIAEDNRINQVLIKKLLKNMACTFDIANSGQEVLDILGAQHDVILMDCSMPVLDGYQATKAIRAMDTELSTSKIIAVTANSMPEDKQKCLDAGMDDYITKPIISEQLYQALMKIKVSRE